MNGYPKPPSDLPASPSPTTRVCVPAAPNANQQKSSLATSSDDDKKAHPAESVARIRSQPGSEGTKATSGRPLQHTVSKESPRAGRDAIPTMQKAPAPEQKAQEPDVPQFIKEASQQQLPYTVHPPEITVRCSSQCVAPVGGRMH